MHTGDKLTGPVDFKGFMSYNEAVAFRLVSGVSPLDKFGANPLITTGTDPEDIWEFGGRYIYDADGTAPIQFVVSTSGSDTGQTISVEGLDIEGNFVSQDITTNGTTNVPLSTPLWRVFRMENMSDAGGEIVGTLYTHIGPTANASTIRAMIDNGNNQSLMALYTVPKGKVGFLVRGELGVELDSGFLGGTEYARLHYESKRFGKVFKVKKSITCTTNGTAIYQDSRSFPDIVPALTDIRLSVIEVSADMGVWAAFDMLIVDQDKLPNWLLTAIGQDGM